MPRLSLPSVHLLLCHSPRRAGGPAGPPAHVEARCLPPVPRMSLPSDRLLFHQRTGREAGLPAPTVSLREASTGEARCGLQPVSSSVTQRAAAEQGRAAHSVTARGVDCRGALPSACLLLCNSPGRGGLAGEPPTVSRHEVPCLWPVS